MSPWYSQAAVLVWTNAGFLATALEVLSSLAHHSLVHNPLSHYIHKQLNAPIAYSLCTASYLYFAQLTVT